MISGQGILRTFHRRRDGSILMETAIVLPILLLLLGGAVEMGFFILANQKMNSLAAGMADMIARADEGIAESEITDVFAAVRFIAEPFDLDADGRVIVSAIEGDDNNGNTIVWQRCAGTLAVGSGIGSEGDDSRELPGELALAEDDMTVVAEVVYDYSPRVLIGFFQPRRIRADATFRPRFGALTEVTDDGAPPSVC